MLTWSIHHIFTMILICIHGVFWIEYAFEQLHCMHDCFVTLKFKAIALAPLNFFCKLKRLHLHSDKSISDLTPRSCTFGSGLGLLGTRYLNKIFKKWHFEINNGPVPFHWESYNDIKTNSPLWTNQRMSVSSTHKCWLRTSGHVCLMSEIECRMFLNFIFLIWAINGGMIMCSN